MYYMRKLFLCPHPSSSGYPFDWSEIGLPLARDAAHVPNAVIEHWRWRGFMFFITKYTRALEVFFIWTFDSLEYAAAVYFAYFSFTSTFSSSCLSWWCFHFSFQHSTIRERVFDARLHLVYMLNTGTGTGFTTYSICIATRHDSVLRW